MCELSINVLLVPKTNDYVVFGKEQSIGNFTANNVSMIVLFCAIPVGSVKYKIFCHSSFYTNYCASATDHKSVVHVEGNCFY